LGGGLSCGVLRYNVTPAWHPSQIFEAATVMAYLREHVDEEKLTTPSAVRL